ncbi:hypothetical protein CVT24_010690, partial [Panaeolus cyanescens]
MGYMDIKSPAEILQDAKDSLRESATSSLDGAMKIYPVQMQPIDWFESLSTSFTTEDLTDDRNILVQKLDNKSQQLDMLTTRLTALQGVSHKNRNDLQKKLDSAQEQYHKAASDLNAQYASNVLSLAKACITKSGIFNETLFNAMAKKRSIKSDAHKDIKNQMADLSKKQMEVDKAARAVSQLAAETANAEAQDTTQEVVRLKISIQALQREIKELTAQLQEAPPNEEDEPSPSKSLEDTPIIVPDSGATGGSRWQEVQLYHECKSVFSSTSDKSKGSAGHSDLSLFYGSRSSQHSSGSAEHETEDSSSSVKVSIGFRATLVTVDRGGWFQPQLLKQSNAFHSIDTNVTWNRWPANTTFENFKDTSESPTNLYDEINKHLLPSYPVGFLICKDITIKIHTAQSTSTTSNKSMHEAASSSSSILCW